MTNKDSLGDRIKRYENVTRNFATPRMPLIIRCDSRAFHTLTRNCKKPFDQDFIDAMVNAAIETANDMQGFKAAYVQSNEVTFFLSDYNSLQSQGWFEYNLSKIISISASLMTANFNKYYAANKLAVFDSRAFSVPIEDVANVFLWRSLDWKRNSIQMLAQSNFSHKELHGKSCNDLIDMLHGIGKYWECLPDIQKNGTFIINNSDGFQSHYNVRPVYSEISELLK